MFSRMINLWKSIYVQANSVRAVFLKRNGESASVCVKYGQATDEFTSNSMPIEEAEKLSAEIVDRINNNHA